MDHRIVWCRKDNHRENFLWQIERNIFEYGILDGDTLREVFGNDLGYSDTDRRKCAMRYSRLCDLLQKQGIHVVCCTISMFDSVRQWNRENIANYHEIYVEVSDETLQNVTRRGYIAGIRVEMKQNSQDFKLG